MASTAQMQARAKANKQKAKPVYQAQPAMNSYQITVVQEENVLRKWLLQNECPKAAKSITRVNDTTLTYVVEGNVSASSQVGVFERLGYKYTCTPIGNSQALPRLYIY